MKLKNLTLKLPKSEYTLRDQLSEGGYSMVYDTTNPEVICKVQVLSNEQVIKTYKNQKETLEKLKHKNIVKLWDSTQMKVQGTMCGFLFLERCDAGTVFNILEKSQGTELSEKTIIKIMITVCKILQYMHGKGYTHRDIKMQNILINKKDQLKLCDFGSCSKQVITKIDNYNRLQIQQEIQKSTTPLYRSPQQLDLYAGFEIGTKVDIFALGVMGFMMCFQKQPFQSRLSAINGQYFLPQDTGYSSQFLELIKRCFITNPTQRPSSIELLEELQRLEKLNRVQLDINLQRQIYITMNQLTKVSKNSLKKTDVVAETGFFDKIKRIINQMTTQTEGWIAGFVEDNEEAPLIKYNRSIISKCYEKRYKIEKVYELIWKFSEEYRNRSLVILKLLILLHNFLRKGPKEAISFDGEHSPLKLCTKLYKLWKSGMKYSDEQDIKRNVFVCLMIRSYSLLIIAKIKICHENSHLIQSNYSIMPYLTNRTNIILNLQFIEQMLHFLQKLIDFQSQIQRSLYLAQIQKSIILSVIDQSYCLISTLTFIYSGYKIGLNYVKSDINHQKLKAKLNKIDKQFEDLYTKLKALYEGGSKYAVQFEQCQVHLNMDVINFIKSIRLEKRSGQFVITDHLNFNKSIFGLKLPESYEEVIKNPNYLKDLDKNSTKNQHNTVEIKEFEMKKNSPQSSPPIIKPPQIDQKNTPQNTKTTAFTKPKDDKSKVFQNFDFTSNTKKPQQPKNSHMMEFTHQNLNKDFMTTNGKVKQDQFKDFFSIVEVKYEKQKQVKKQSQKKKQSAKQTKEMPLVSNASKEVFPSENGPAINNIELMNFFEDDDEVNEKQNTMKGNIANKNLIDLGEEEQIKNSQQKSIIQKTDSPKKENKITDMLINLDDDTQEIQKPQEKIQIKQQEKISKETPKIQQQKKLFGQKSQLKPQTPSFIDLKGFVVEQVKKNAQQYLIQFNTLIFKQKVGYGNSSEVYKGEWRGRQIAIKKIKNDSSITRSQKQFKREIMTSVKIRHHPQLVTLIGVCEHDKHFYIINQFCNGGTLFDLLHQSPDRVPWKTRINIAKQIVRGMIFLHTNDPPIIHRDMKSLNVLLVNEFDKNNPDLVAIKIADFGLSRDYASSYMTGTLGTYHWMAPQIFNNEPYTLKADVYSFAIVLWQIASRLPPYTNMKNPQSLMKYVTMENGRPDLSSIDSECPLEIKMLMIRSWDKFPGNRPSFQEILWALEAVQVR